MLETPELHTQKLVIGYSLGALEWARENKGMLLVNALSAPHPIENKEEAARWYQLIFELGMAGLTPIPSAIEAIRVEENTARIATETHALIKIAFEELYIFDMEKVEGISIEERVKDYIVYDWFDVKRGAKQADCKVLAPRDFVKKLVFYPSQRKDGNDGSFKDCYTKSYIAAEELEEFEYSETAARFAAMKLIKENGINGPKRNNGDKSHYLNVVLEHNRRDIHKNEKEFIMIEEPPANIFCMPSEKWK